MRKNKNKSNETLEKEIEVLEDGGNIIVENDEKQKNPKKVRRQKRSRAFFILWNIASIIFYGISTATYLIKDFKHDLFTYFIIGAVVIYVIVFSIIVATTSSTKKLAKNTVSTYKTQIKIWKTFLGLFNLALTINILVNAFLNEKDWFVIILIVFGFIFAIIRVFLAFISLIILFYRQAKISAKRKQIKAREKLDKYADTMIKSK